MDSYKLNKAIGYIKQFEFPFDCFDVEEDIDTILTFYGIFEDFNRDEKTVLMDELMETAEAIEFSEAARRQEPILKIPTQKEERFSLEQAIIERKVLLSQVKG